jgi:hypothetical protein
VLERIFERHSGNVSLRLEAGALWHQHQQSWKEQPLPYGTRPRLVMVHITTEAVRRQTKIIEVGNSIRQFLVMLGIGTSGGKTGGYTMFKKQMLALAACRLLIGSGGTTINTQPIHKFEAWLHNDGDQTTLWPGVMELSDDFYNSLAGHAVPLDHRALGALQHSALALDIYTWFAHRLCRIKQPGGVKLTWQNLMDQFGQEYQAVRSFKQEFLNHMRQVCAVYRDAKVEEISGGLLLKKSPPPIRKTTITAG